MFKTRTYVMFSAALAAALTLSACAGGSTGGIEHGGSSHGDSSAGSPSAGEASAFNDADVTFAQMMIPHHEQAVEMSDVVLAKDGIDPRVADLATQIKAAQEPEIEQLKTWLAEWDAEPSGSGHDGHGDGMMSEADMDALNSATGVEASRLFLEQMTVHHEGAIAMAQTKLDDGKNVDAQNMAETIIRTQTDEINVMTGMLASL